MPSDLHLEEDREKSKKKKTINRLSDMIVSDVDVVDRAANKRRFLLTKREEPMPGEIEVLETRDGEVLAIGLSDAEADAHSTKVKKGDPESADKEDDEKKDDDEKKPEKKGDDEEMAKGGVMVCEKCRAKMPRPPSMKAETMDCPKCDGKMKAESAKAESADKEDDNKDKDKDKDKDMEKATAIPKPVQGAILKVFGEATERLMSVVSVLRSATATDDQSAAPLPNAISKELNAIGALLKSVKDAYPSPTAKSDHDPAAILKEADGLTVPGAVRDAVVTKSRALIEELLSLTKAVRNMKTTEDKMEAPMPPAIAKALDSIGTALDELTSKYPSPASKSDSILTELQTHFDGIKNIVSGALQGNVSVEPSSKTEHKDKDKDKEEEEMEDKEKKCPLGEEDDEKKKKGEDSEVEKLRKQVDGLTKKLEEVTGKKVIPVSNSKKDGGGKSKVEKKTPFRWSEDLAEDIRKRKVAK